MTEVQTQEIIQVLNDIKDIYRAYTHKPNQDNFLKLVVNDATVGDLKELQSFYYMGIVEK